MNYFAYDFFQHALVAGTLAAILGAVVGYFVIVRNVAFAAHALSHIGFTGAAAAAFIGLNPLEGILLFTVGAGLAMGASGDRLQRSDMAIGMVLSISLGLGALFLSFYRGYAGQTKSILFGDIFSVSLPQILEMSALSLITLGGLAFFARKLLFVSIQPRLAEARGISITAISTAFMIVLAVAVSLASQVVGVLLVFTLVIAPAGIALRLSRSFWGGMLLAIALAVAVVWAGLLLGVATNWPVSFWITAIFFVVYLAVELHARLAR